MLAERLPVERLQQLLAAKEQEQALPVATAIVLGLSGLLAAQADSALTALWHGYADLWPLPPLTGDAWVRAGVRPANRPELRLRGIAALVARTARDGLVASLLTPLRYDDVERLVASLEVTAPDERTPPIGRGRALEMAINVVAPFALALARRDGDGALEDAAWRVVATMPDGDDSAPLRSMRALLAGSGHRLRPYGALEQQGLLHLHRSYCHARACWECPLAT
jgi:hypothetical protein